MRPTCLICGKEFESTRCVGKGDMQKFWICDSCRADAALGRDAEAELSRLRAENVAKDAEIERLKAILADALEWGMTSKHFDAGRSLKNGEDARAAISRAEQAKPETETCAWTVSENGVWIQHGCTGAQMLKGHLFIRPETCPYCKKKLIIEQAGKAEGRQG